MRHEEGYENGTAATSPVEKEAGTADHSPLHQRAACSSRRRGGIWHQALDVGTDDAPAGCEGHHVKSGANGNAWANGHAACKRGAQKATRMQATPYQLHLADCLAWMAAREPSSIHAIVTDPPYGVKEYTAEEKAKLRNGRGGVWRIPPSFDGHQRSPLPRFTVLSDEEREGMRAFFTAFAKHAFRVLVPGGHVFIAANPLLSHLVYLPMVASEFEKRGEIIRLVQTLRGGDRPKNAHQEFPGVSVMPRSAWEPWGLFRKPCEGRVQDNLRKWKTGGLRRVSGDQPFADVIPSSPTRPEERALSNHPSLKPQGFMRQVVRAALPLGEGVVLDPFMGGGSTIAAAVAIGYSSIGIELDPAFYKVAADGIPKLAAFATDNLRFPFSASDRASLPGA